MGVQDYVADGDELHASAAFQSDPYALFFSGKAGEIGVTDSELLHVSGSTVNMIAIDEVGSIEYTEPKTPRTYLFAGIGALAFAFFGGGDIQGLAEFAWILGPILLLTAYWLRTSTLTIYTASRNYELQSRHESLADVVEAYQQRQRIDRA